MQAMSGQTTYSLRNVSRRASDRNISKLAVGDSGDIALDRDVNVSTTPDSWMEIVENSRPSAEGHIDIFGEPKSPTESGRKSSTKTKYVRKTPISKKKKQPSKNLVENRSSKKPQKTFTSTPRIIKTMKETLSESYSTVEVNQCSTDTLIVTDNSLNISGIQSLQDSSTLSVLPKSDLNSTKNNDDEKSTIFKGKLEIIFVYLKVWSLFSMLFTIYNLSFCD